MKLTASLLRIHPHPQEKRHGKFANDCDDLDGFLRVTHALPLNDTFLVKEADSDFCWDSVSLYQNEFDQLWYRSLRSASAQTQYSMIWSYITISL